MKEKIMNFCRKAIQFILNPRLLICLGLGWIITNGWCYVFIFVGTFFHIPWLLAIGSGYLAFLWIPITQEKIITLMIAMFLLKKLFPEDKQTLAILEQAYQSIKNVLTKKKLA